MRSIRLAAAALMIAVMSMFVVPARPALAFGHHHGTTVHHRSFVHRHKMLTSVAAGYAAYKIAKHTGHNRTMAGRHRNFAQRHPFLTGIGAAAVTHHMLKKSEHRR